MAVGIKLTNSMDNRLIKKGSKEIEDSFDKLATNAKNNLGGKAKAAAGALAAAFAFDAIISGIGEVISATADMGRELDEISSKLGTSASQSRAIIRGLKGDSGAAEGSIASLVQKIQEATEGNEDAIKSFASFGLTIDDFKNQNPAEQFATMVTAMKDVGKTTESMTVATRILGEDGVKQYDNMINSLHLWQNASDPAFDESIKKASEFSFKLQELKEDVLIVLFDGLKPLVSVLSENSDAIKDAAKALVRFMAMVKDTTTFLGELHPTLFLTKRAMELFAGQTIESHKEVLKSNKKLQESYKKQRDDQLEGIQLSRITQRAVKMVTIALTSQDNVLKKYNKSLQKKKVFSQEDIKVTTEKILTSKALLSGLASEIKAIEASTVEYTNKSTAIKHVNALINDEIKQQDALKTELKNVTDAVRNQEKEKRKEFEKTASKRLAFEKKVADELKNASIKEIEKIRDLKKSIDDILKPSETKATKKKFGLDKENLTSSDISDASRKAFRSGASLEELKVLAGVIKERQEAGEKISDTTLRNFEKQVEMAEKTALEAENINKQTQDLLKEKKKLEEENANIAAASINGDAIGGGASTELTPFEQLEESNSIQNKMLEELIKQTASLDGLKNNLTIAKITIS